ncbi:MAG: hypothetical protein K1X75_14170 [Leptospirales bacterium]|nr:hypothetical protein [Leptospirales bacterium]
MPGRRLGQKLSIDNLNMYLLIGTLLVSGGLLLSPWHPGVISFQRVFEAGEYWRLALFPFQVGAADSSAGGFDLRDVMMVLLYCWMLWSFGSGLELELGSARFTAFVLSAMASLLVGALLLTPGSLSATYFAATLIVAFGLRQPEAQILIWFVIPVRLRWIAVTIVAVTVALAALEAVATGSVFALLKPVFVFSAALIVWRRPRLWHEGRGGSRSARFQDGRAMEGRGRVAVHRCTVCGVTELSDPSMDFRYCVDCDDHEYCSRHLKEHLHIRATDGHFSTDAE